MPASTPAFSVLLALLLVAPASGQSEAEHDLLAVPIQVGPSHHAWNSAGVALEIFPAGQDHLSAYVVAGLGTIFTGAGAAFYTDRYGHGLVASVTAGLAGAHANVGGQLRPPDLWGQPVYLTGGLGYGV